MEERTRRSIALEDPAAYPNADDGSSGGTVLQLALFHAPVATVTALLDACADPDFDALDGFPALLLVLGHTEVARMLRAAEAG